MTYAPFSCKNSMFKLPHQVRIPLKHHSPQLLKNLRPYTNHTSSSPCRAVCSTIHPLHSSYLQNHITIISSRHGNSCPSLPRNPGKERKGLQYTRQTSGGDGNHTSSPLSYHRYSSTIHPLFIPTILPNHITNISSHLVTSPTS